MRRPRAALLLAGVAGLAGCAASRPVLYPNAGYDRVPADQRERDVAECLRLAEAHVSANERPAEAARHGATGAATGAVVGAAGGAAGGAVVGHAARGAAAGGAGGAGAGLLHGLVRALSGRSRPDKTERRFVEHCLRKRGYEPIGWR
jgi:hypothetical protein